MGGRMGRCFRGSCRRRPRKCHWAHRMQEGDVVGSHGHSRQGDSWSARRAGRAEQEDQEAHGYTLHTWGSPHWPRRQGREMPYQWAWGIQSVQPW